MKTLIVGFSTSESLFSFIIKRATSSDVSHTYLRLPTPFGEDIIFQASELSVNYCNGKVFESKSKVMEEYEVEISDEQWDIAEKFRVTEVGKPYSAKQIVGFGWILFCHAMGKNVNNPLADGSNSYICTEVVSVCIGLKNVENWSPGALRDWCKEFAKRII